VVSGDVLRVTVLELRERCNLALNIRNVFLLSVEIQDLDGNYLLGRILHSMKCNGKRNISVSSTTTLLLVPSHPMEPCACGGIKWTLAIGLPSAGPCFPLGLFFFWESMCVPN
jgi:hypothetical protein